MEHGHLNTKITVTVKPSLFRFAVLLWLSIDILIITPSLVWSQQLAFPGAEGFGRYVTGGRGGAVIEVTNLNDAGSGSFREACLKSGPRTIVFRVSGTIRLLSKLTIKSGDLTIAGQSAPGDGICIAGYSFFIGASNVIVRYMRFRLGNLNVANCECDAFGGEQMTGIIIDHCSMSWSIDEVASFYDNTNFTMQWCIISESLYNSGHVKGNHGYGGIQGGSDASFHHNLYASNTSRNPRFSGGRYYTSSAILENVDFRNNVIFNWGFNSVYGGELGQQNMINNYYKAGPATKSGVKNRIVDINRGTESNPGKWYIAGNFVTGYPAISTDNWAGGVQGNDAGTAGVRMMTPFPAAPVTTQTPEDAFASVLANAGAILPKRDALDTRIISEVTSGICSFGDTYDPQTGVSLSHTGIINSQSTVGGWPMLFAAPPLPDRDKDGMPDSWEIAKGLNPDNASDRNNTGTDGYTMLEIYLNGIGSSPLYTLKVSATGSGTVSPTGVSTYHSGTMVNLTATPGTGFKFINWVDGSGNSLGTANMFNITMDDNKTITAIFTAINSNDKHIAYVTDPASDLYRLDTKILPALRSEPGFLITETDLSRPTSDYSGFDLVIFSEVCQSGSTGVAALKGLDKPMLFMKPKAYNPGIWNWTSNTSSNGYDASQKNVVVSNTAHQVFNTPYQITFINSNEVQVLSEISNSKGLTYMDPDAFSAVVNGTINPLASVKGGSKAKSCLFEIPAKTIVSGTTVQQKFIQIGYAADSYSAITSDGVKIVLNACHYLMGMSKPTAITTSIPKRKLDVALVNDILIIDLPDEYTEDTTIQIYAVNGTSLYSTVWKFGSPGRVEINQIGLKSGIYLCNVRNIHHNLTQKFIIR
jgi:hypothetical protein